MAGETNFFKMRAHTGHVLGNCVLVIGLIVITSIFAFDGDQGLPSITNSINISNGGFDDRLAAVVVMAEEVCDTIGLLGSVGNAAALNIASVEEQKMCDKNVKDFAKSLDGLVMLKDSPRPLVRSGHLWYKYYQHLNYTQFIPAEIEANDLNSAGGKILSDHISYLKKAQDGVIQLIDSTHEEMKALQLLDTVNNAVIAAFALLIIYLSVNILELYFFHNPKNNFLMLGTVFRSPTVKSVLYWIKGAHVFTIVLIACAVLGTALSNDYFADQATVGCRNYAVTPTQHSSAFPITSGAVTTISSLSDIDSSGGLLELSFDNDATDAIDHKCQKNSINTVHDNIWFLVWTYCVFSMIYVASHLTITNGPEQDVANAALHALAGDRSAKTGAPPAGRAKVAKRVTYQPLTSIHNR